MRVRYTRTAARQIASALDYLAEDSPAAARDMSERLRAVLAHLREHPFMGRATSVRHIRRFPLGSFPSLVDYSVERDDIVVRRFRHTSRRPLS
ncbi:type II toxin-antitoxin system RelE/ParE family toxin [Methylobacterium aerolatum]|uniref:type II toxin-antitoxin system RelE/ParE family toxin n=1 Tax=Methylobacterium aerolatum TaxID=418708 RepID=UPI001EDDB7D1|nr:type II toxin-antitoxin system RelE/ParE family toxin [Methylobacterium aerolatum]